MLKINFSHYLFFFVTLCLSACTGSSPVTKGIADRPWVQGNSARESGPGFTFRAGDTLELYVLEDSTLDGKYPVRQTGDVIISRLGRVEAVGKTTREIESDIKGRLQKTQLKEATVIVDTLTLFGDGQDASGRPKVVVYVYGQVAKQGLLEIPGVRGRSITCLDAVVHAGGFGPFANKKKVTIVRKTIERGNYTLPVDLKAVEEGHVRDEELESGDIIKVPAKMFGFGY
jgi:polysaccharide export outer membrane protein